MSRISFCLVVGVCVANIAAAFASAQETQSEKKVQRLLSPEQGAYSQVKSLEEAIDTLKLQLTNREEKEYAPLFTVEGVKHAIKTSVRGIDGDHDALIQKARSNGERARANRRAKYFRGVVKPVYEQIVLTGNWPAGAFFLPTPKRPPYSSFAVNLHLDMRRKNTGGYEVVPGIKPAGHAIQILTLEYGHEVLPESHTLSIKPIQ